MLRVRTPTTIMAAALAFILSMPIGGWVATSAEATVPTLTPTP